MKTVCSYTFIPGIPSVSIARCSLVQLSELFVLIPPSLESRHCLLPGAHLYSSVNCLFLYLHPWNLVIVYCQVLTCTAQSTVCSYTSITGIPSVSVARCSFVQLSELFVLIPPSLESHQCLLPGAHLYSSVNCLFLYLHSWNPISVYCQVLTCTAQ